MVLTKRFKVLCAVAVAVGVYIVATLPDAGSEQVAAVAAPTHGERGAAVTGTATGTGAARNAVRQPDGGNMFARLAHRVTTGKAVEALFHPQSWYVAPPPPPPAPYVPPPPPPPPTAPPLPFTVMGSYARHGQATVYFLTRGDRVFDVHVGDTIDNTYSVDSAANGQLTLTYKPLNIQQTLAVGG